jgi:hypothetical protein
MGLANLLRRAALLLDPTPAPVSPLLPPAPLPEESAFEQEGPVRNERNKAALELVDPEVYGYVLLTLRKDRDEGGRIVVKVGVPENRWWPFFYETFDRIEDATREHTPGG